MLNFHGTEYSMRVGVEFAWVAVELLLLVDAEGQLEVWRNRLVAWGFSAVAGRFSHFGFQL